MNEWLDLSDGRWWHVAGWTMLHFLWLGTLVGLAGGVCRLLVRRASANLRYATALLCFLVLAALPIGICAWLTMNQPARVVDVAETTILPNNDANLMQSSAPGSAGGIVGTVSADGSAPPTPIVAREPAIETHPDSNPRQSRGLADVFASLAEYLPWAWLTGTPLTFLLLATGVIGAERLRRSSRVLDDGPIAEACAELAKSLLIGGRVTVAVCERIAAPVLVGILRPMILLPSAALTGWSPEEIEMVLLHELAHVRRWDNLVNLVQRFVEAALFFHPAVWLVSRWVRAEREACCDAVVVGCTNRPHAYAETLVALAAQLPRSVLFHPTATSAMAAGPLRSRIHRILNIDDDPMLVSGKSLGVVTSGLLLAATLVVLNLSTRGQAEESTTNGKVTVEQNAVVSESTTGADSRDPETELLLKEITDLQRAKNELEERLTELTSNFDRAKSVMDVQKARSGREETNLSLQSMTKEFRIRQSVLQQQISAIEKSLNDKSELRRREREFLDNLNAVDVPFEVGASHFADGDRIAIREIRGTSNTFAPGNTYWIKGTYTLRSSDRASLGASVTARSAASAITTPHDPDQSIKIERGSGEFTLKLPMHGDGWRHVSFYPIDGGQSFGGVYFGTGNSVLKKWWEVYGSDDTRSAESQAKIERGKFPSLEEQKLADLAYRRLGIELAELDEADLKRVRYLGYGGGLSATISGNHGPTWEEVQTGDLLVGLAVWPTTTLEDVSAVLNRDDLAELSPLKFYVIRPVSDPRRTKVPPPDKVVTGRIDVKLDRESSQVTPEQVALDPQPLPRTTVPAAEQYSAERSISLTPQQMAEIVTPQPAQPQPLTVEPQPDSNLVDPLPAGAAKILREKGPIVVEVFYQDKSEPCRQMLDNVKAFQRTNLNSPVEFNRKNAEVEVAAVAKHNIDRTPAIVVTKNGVVLKKVNGLLSTEEFTHLLSDIAFNLALTAENQPTLRYNGKTFEEWRAAWQTELSLEKRLEVVKALAAFGASGRGKEAAEAILDVANQLDWSFIDGETAAGRLKQACVDAFVSGRTTEGYRIPTEAWWPLVAPIYENSADKKTIITYLSYQLPTGDTDLIPKLLELSHKNEATRNLALSGLKAIDPKLEDDRVVSRLRESLKDANKSPAELRGAINSLYYSPSSGRGGHGPQTELRWVPELQPLLFHVDPEVRQTARAAITKAQPRDAAALVEYLVDVVDTKGRERERCEATRALAALGMRAAPAEEKLKAIAHNPKDSCRIPAAAALLAMWPDVANWDSESKLRKVYGSEFVVSADADDDMRKLKAEQTAVFGVDTQSYGGGGVF